MNSKLNKELIEIIEKNEVLVFSTSSKDGYPHSVVVLPSKIEENRIILSNIQMEKTIKNLNENNKCFINIYSKEDNDLQIKIDGKATIFDSGELYSNIKEYEEKNNLPPELKVNSIIVVDIENVEISNE